MRSSARVRAASTLREISALTPLGLGCGHRVVLGSGLACGESYSRTEQSLAESAASPLPCDGAGDRCPGGVR